MTTTTGVVVIWPESHPWTDADWVRRTFHRAVNLVAGVLYNPAVPVIWLNVRGDLPEAGHTSEGWSHRPNGAPYYGQVRFDWAELFSGKWDVIYTMAHEVGHAFGVHWHNPDPADLMYRYTRPAANPWDGKLTANDVLAFQAVGFEASQRT